MASAAHSQTKPGNHEVREAVLQHGQLSRKGLLERAFTFAFRGLLYAQIWEDPIVDLEALHLEPDTPLVTIASGGCNVLSYLIINPARYHRRRSEPPSISRSTRSSWPRPRNCPNMITSTSFSAKPIYRTMPPTISPHVAPASLPKPPLRFCATPPLLTAAPGRTTVTPPSNILIAPRR